MKLIPGRSLVLALFVPVTLAFAALAERSLVAPMLVVDGVVLAAALLDAALVIRGKITATRTVPEIWSLARPVTVELEVRSRARRALIVLLQEALFPEAESQELPLSVLVPAGGRVTATYRVRSTRRGTHALGSTWVRYASPLGFWIRQLEVKHTHSVRVYPDVVAVRQYELMARQNRDLFASRLSRHRGGDTEFERLRDYLPDDELRRVDWKATARRRKLTVREHQLEQNQSVMFMLDCGRLMTSVWAQLSALDYALNATLMMSHVAVRRGDLVGLLAFDDGVKRLIKPRSGVRASNQLIQATFDLFPTMVESDYDAAFRTLRLQVQRRTLVVFITHAIDDPTARRLEKLSRELMPLHLPLVVMLRDAELERPLRTPPASVEAACVSAAVTEVLMWRDQRIRELERSGVMVLDVFHHELTGALVSRYLEIKARGLI